LDDALVSLETAAQVGHGHAAAVAAKAFALVRAGRSDGALKLLDDLKDRKTSPHHVWSDR
jgi:pentatricopeptide repeat protein